jgi:hypothetical protein
MPGGVEWRALFGKVLMRKADPSMKRASGLEARPGRAKGGDRLKLRLMRVLFAVSVLAMSVMVLGAGAKLR